MKDRIYLNKGLLEKKRDEIERLLKKTIQELIDTGEDIKRNKYLDVTDELHKASNDITMYQSSLLTLEAVLKDYVRVDYEN